MALPRLGGETPLIKYGLELTVEAPTGTDSAAPVLPGQIFKLGGTATDGTGYKAAACTAGDDAGTAILLMALHRCDDLNLPLGVKVISHNGIQVRRLAYDTVAPSIGQSIEIGTDVTKVVGKTFAAGHGYVLVADTTNEEVEVLV